MACGCKDKKNVKCGSENTDKSVEEQLKHLRDCKESFTLKIKDIDEAITKINN